MDQDEVRQARREAAAIETRDALAGLAALMSAQPAGEVLPCHQLAALLRMLERSASAAID